MRLSGKTAIVTGAAHGIGFALARRFAEEGARVAVTDLDTAACEAAASTINAETSERAFGLAMDVTDEDGVQAAVDTLASRFGHIDIVVNNAGIQIVAAVDQLSYADWKRVLAVHLDGAFLVTRACLRRMYAAGNGGSLIFMGSVHSKLASVLKAPYVAAKHGLAGLCRTVAKEGAPHGVRANLICPSFVRTQLVEKQIPEQAQLLGISEEAVVRNVMLKDTVDGQFAETSQIADAAVFFASSDSLAFTGQSLLVSHGWHME